MRPHSFELIDTLIYRFCRVITDFERTTLSVVRKVYPNVHHLCCNFVFQQGVMKQVKGLGLASLYCKRRVNPTRNFILEGNIHSCEYTEGINFP